MVRIIINPKSNTTEIAMNKSEVTIEELTINGEKIDINNRLNEISEKNSTNSDENDEISIKIKSKSKKQIIVSDDDDGNGNNSKNPTIQPKIDANNKLDAEIPTNSSDSKQTNDKQDQVNENKQNTNDQLEADKMWTGRRDKELKRQLKLETLRRIRELELNLPCNPPRPLSYEQWALRRAYLARPNLPQAPPSIAIKLAGDQLKEVSEKVDQRIKQVEELYKSDDGVTTNENREFINNLLDTLIDKAVNQSDERKQNQPIKFVPKLTNGLNGLIDLNDNKGKNEIDLMVNKLIKHTTKKLNENKIQQLNVITLSGGEICEEKLIINNNEDLDVEHYQLPSSSDEANPGRRFKQLREDLKLEMAKKRAQEWRMKTLKIIETINNEDVMEEDKLLDDEDEEDIEDESESDEEYVEEKISKNTCEFIEDEAEIDGDDEDSDEDKDQLNETQTPKKSFKRIQKPIEDSDEDEDDTTLSYDAFTPNLPCTNPSVLPTESDENELDCFTPISHLTGLENMIENFAPESPIPTDLSTSDHITDTQIELCSGTFPMTQNGVTESSMNTQDILEMCSGQFTSNLNENDKTRLNEAEKSLITQIIDEDEVEQNLNATSYIIDDELGVKTRKNRQILICTSDEDEDEIEAESKMISTECDYDSEENPRVVNEFVESEAELSESDWASEDENEENLDHFDVEQGDEDVFDEKKLKENLEKIHVRKMLDEDSHRVKILQDLLLEYGEMDGIHRKRQFKWKNIDANVEDETNPQTNDKQQSSEDEVEESEELWRKMRYKREMFLKTQQSTNKPLNFQSKIVRKPKIVSNNKPSFDCLNKPQTTRGSFLSRSDDVLQKLAEITTNIPTNVTTVKNSNNFLFQTTKTTKTIEDKKRKANNQQINTPKGLKRLKLGQSVYVNSKQDTL